MRKINLVTTGIYYRFKLSLPFSLEKLSLTAMLSVYAITLMYIFPYKLAITYTHVLIPKNRHH